MKETKKKSFQSKINVDKEVVLLCLWSLTLMDHAIPVLASEKAVTLAPPLGAYTQEKYYCELGLCFIKQNTVHTMKISLTSICIKDYQE